LGAACLVGALPEAAGAMRDATGRPRRELEVLAEHLQQVFLQPIISG
jgi:hypothetical protein